MLLTSFDPFVQDFDRLAQRVFGAVDGAPVRPVMPMDAIRRDNEVELRFDLPGVDRDSIDVTIERNVLSVTARRAEEYGEGEDLVARERVSGTFTRHVRLGDTIDAGGIEAAYTDGVLAVRLPFSEQARARKVEIQAGGLKKLTA